MDHGFIPNLHVILLGDSQRAGAYLPYGKHLVRQLLASRQPYGKRVGRPGSGIMVEAWVSGEHRWVRITAEECGPFLMESGIVGLQNIGFLYSHLNDGLMHYSPQIRTYGADKRLLGKLNKLPGLASTVTPELQATPAMSAELDDEGNRDPSSEGALVMKKYCAATIPPSIFTGKLRLYFQAHYGKKLASWDFSPNTANQPPSLDWTTKKGGDDYTFQFHSSSTGIFTDSAKRHWLVQLGTKGSSATTDQANVFKMVAHPCAERMRPLLLDPDVSDDDKERIEAYILAASYPDPGFCVSKPVSIPINYSLGYGWHFNWSGTAADIVEIETISTGGSSYKHRSTHHRINIERHDEYVDDPTNTALENEDRRWSFDLEQVEQAEWKNSKWTEVIACPDWSEKKLVIFGALFGATYGSAAPVYCFYNRDELRVVRYTRSGGGANVTGSGTSSPVWFMGEYARGPGLTFPCAGYNNVGGHASSLDQREYPADDIVKSFECAGASIDATDASWSFWRVNRSSISYTSTGTRDDFYIADYASSDFNVGDPSVTTTAPGCYVSHTSDVVTVHGPAYGHEAVLNAEYNVTNITGDHAESSELLCVIPFGDAEAAYLWGAQSILENFTGSSGARTTSGFWGAVGIRRYVVSGQNYDAPTRTTGLSITGPNSYSDFTTVISQLGAHFISGNGVQTFDPGTATVTSAFFAGEPTTHVEQQFWTRTSAGLYRDTDGAGAALTGGYDVALNSKPYVFTGWA